MVDGGGDDTKHPQSFITENGVRQLMSQMIQHGLLLTLGDDGDASDDAGHRSHCCFPNDHENDDSIDAFRRWKQQYHHRQTSEQDGKDTGADSRCRLVATLSKDSYYTVPNGIRKAVLSELSSSLSTTTTTTTSSSSSTTTPGRMTISEMACRLGVSEKSLEQATSSFCCNNSQYKNDDSGNCCNFHNDIRADVERKLDDRVLTLVIRGQSELIAWSYWDYVCTEIYRRLGTGQRHQDDEGSHQCCSLNVLGLSKEFNLPIDIFQSFVLSNLDSTRVTLLDDPMRIVNQSFLSRMKDQAQAFFSNLTKPINISTACQQHKDDGWDLKMIVSWMNGENDDGFQKACDGEFHFDNSGSVGLAVGSSGVGGIAGTIVTAGSGGTGIFVPNIYLQQQQKAILDYLYINGYITSERANQIQGVSVSEMIKIVEKEHGDNAIVIKDDLEKDSPGSNSGMVIILMQHFLQGLQVFVQDYLDTKNDSSSSSMVAEAFDLQSYLSPELMRSPSLVMRLLAEAGLTKSFFDKNGGIVVVVEGRGIVVRTDFLQHLNDVLVPKVVEDFALTRAAELFANASHGIHGNREDDDTNDEDPPHSAKTSKLKLKGKHTKTKTRKNHGSTKATGDVGLVPLHTVAKAILHNFPSFLPTTFMETYDESCLNDIEWESGITEDEYTGPDCRTNDLLISFCRRAFYTDKFLNLCEQALSAELRRLESTKQSKATISRKEAAARVRNVEGAFEQAFTNLCFLIQAQVKSIKYFEMLSIPGDAGEDHDNAIDILKDELLRGPCADLTSRITQYALFKEGTDFQFSFVPLEAAKTDDQVDDKISLRLPFCDDVDIARRCYPKTYLSCPPPIDPLPALRESFSSNIGTTLARQWVYCGGQCYRGGVIKSPSDESSDQSDHREQIRVRRGNLDEFLSHVEMNSLNLSGLPFKKLDKKAEKKLLFVRKNKLADLLEQTPNTDAQKVLDLTIMLLYEQLKQLLVFGSLLRSFILRALVSERKIPKVVGLLLQRLQEQIERNAVDDRLVVLIKECALCRDISKHDTSGLESYLGSNQ